MNSTPNIQQVSMQEPLLLCPKHKASSVCRVLHLLLPLFLVYFNVVNNYLSISRFLFRILDQSLAQFLCYPDHLEICMYDQVYFTEWIKDLPYCIADKFACCFTAYSLWELGNYIIQDRTSTRLNSSPLCAYYITSSV